MDIDNFTIEGARKTLLFPFRRMLNHEAGTRVGQDIEAIESEWLY
jgi:hypothetical protein